MCQFEAGLRTFTQKPMDARPTNVASRWPANLPINEWGSGAGADGPHFPISDIVCSQPEDEPQLNRAEDEFTLTLAGESAD